MDKKKINTILVGILLSSNQLVGALDMIIQIDNFFAIFVLSLGLLYIINNFFEMRISIFALLFLFVFFLQAILGDLYIHNISSNHYLICFFCIALPSFFCGYQDIDVKVLIKTILMIGLCTLWYPFSIIKSGAFSLTAGEQMGVAYSFLPLLFSSIFCFFSNEEKIYFKICALFIGTISIIVLMFQSTRGALLSCGVFIFLLYFMQKKKVKLFLGALFLLTFAICLLFYRDIVSGDWFSRVFGGRKAEDILNGREKLYSRALSWRGIMDFLFGSGCGSFQPSSVNQIYHPHNLFLHLYYEQGIILASFVLYFCIKSLVYIFNFKTSKETRLIFTFLFSASIVRLIFSYYFWIDPIFWVLIAYTFRQTVLKKGKKI